MDSSQTVGVGGFQYTDDQIAGDIKEYNPFTRPIEFKREYKPTEIQVRPTSSSAGENTQPYEFKVPADPYQWTNLQKIKIGGQMRIVNKTTKNPPNPDTEDFSVVNNFKQAIWSKIIVKINGCEISDPTANPYPWKSYIETLLNYGTEYKENVLKLGSGWIEDKAGDGAKNSVFPTIPDPNDANKKITNDKYNKALVERRLGIQTGGWEEMDVLMHSDIITAQIPLPPGYILEFKMDKMLDNFVIIKPDTNKNEYAIELQDVHLCLERIQFSDSALQAYNLKRNNSIATIPLTRNFIRSYPILKDQTDLCMHNLIVRDQMPESVIIWVTTQSAYNGTTSTNPFYFQTLNVEHCSLLVNSKHEPPVPYTNLTSKFKKQKLFHSFLDNIGSSQRDSVCCSINYDKYFHGYHMFAFDRTKTNRARRYIMEGGSLGVNLQLDTKLPENMQVIVYATYSSDILLKGTEVITKSF